MMRGKPYVSVTGVTTPAQMRKTCKAFEDNDYLSREAGELNIGYRSHLPMIGISINYEILHECVKATGGFPPIGNLANIIAASRGAWTMLHYSPGKLGEDTLVNDIDLLVEKAGGQESIEAIQLNAVWPSKKNLGRIKERHPMTDLCLKVGRNAVIGRNMREIVKAVRDREKFLSYVLIDQSRGQGRELDSQLTGRLFGEFLYNYADVTVGFAGGLGGDNIERKVWEIRQMVGWTTEFFFDAEERLRTRDNLNSQKVWHYLDKAQEALVENRTDLEL